MFGGGGGGGGGGRERQSGPCLPPPGPPGLRGRGAPPAPSWRGRAGGSRCPDPPPRPLLPSAAPAPPGRRRLPRRPTAARGENAREGGLHLPPGVLPLSETGACQSGFPRGGSAPGLGGAQRSPRRPWPRRAASPPCQRARPPPSTASPDLTSGCKQLFPHPFARPDCARSWRWKFEVLSQRAKDQIPCLAWWM